MTRPVKNGVDLSIRQFYEAWKVMCGSSPSSELKSDDGVEYLFSGVPVAFFNVAIVTAQNVTEDELKTYGDQARTFAAERQVPWLFVITNEELEPGLDAAAALDACGLAPIMPLTGMFAQQVSPAATVAPAGLELIVPRDDAGCATVLDINSAAYAMDLGPAKAAIGRSAFWSAHVPVVGMVDGAAASSAAVLMLDGYRYVALVATDPAYQRRGYAEAAMRQALDVAAATHGELPTVLHATEAGRPVYQRMGYTPISTHTLYMDKAFLGGH